MRVQTMRRGSVGLWIGVLLASFALSACGDADKLKALEVKEQELLKQNAELKSQVTDLDAKVTALTQERDRLAADVQKAQAELQARPAPAPTPAKPTKKATASSKRAKHHR